ncbi:MAG: DUF2911 domain-containing protein [Chitinophagaceae bacterium]
MKRLTLLALLVAATTFASAQTSFSGVPSLDKSPMDMVYFPANYPILKIQEKVSTPPVARAIYSRPQTANRAIFGELIEYGKVWRMGANEATEIEFFKDVKIGGKKVPKGRYTLYALINPTEWTMILNKETDTWGSFNYNEKKDVARLTVPVQPLEQVVDAFALSFEKRGADLDLVVQWDKVKVALPIALQ